MSFRTFLLNHHVRELAGIVPITVTINENVVEVFRLLAEKQILSVPVVDENKKYVGLMDTLILLAYIQERVKKEAGLVEGEKLTKEKLSLMESKIMNSTLRDVFAHSKAPSKVRTILASATFLDAVRELTTVHRVVVTDEAGYVVRIVTQSDVVRFVCANLDSITVANRSLKAVETALSMKLESPVVYVNHDDMVLDAIKVLVQNHVTAVPVAKDGEIIGHLSSSDIGVISSSSFYNLLSTVSDVAPLSGIVNVSPSSTLAEVIQKLVSKKIHRIYLVEDSKQVGMLSLTDLMNIFFSS